MIELLGIEKINGRRHPIDYNNRKNRFENTEEMLKYKKILEKKLKTKLYFSFRHPNS